MACDEVRQAPVEDPAMALMVLDACAVAEPSCPPCYEDELGYYADDCGDCDGNTCCYCESIYNVYGMDGW